MKAHYLLGLIAILLLAACGDDAPAADLETTRAHADMPMRMPAQKLAVLVDAASPGGRPAPSLTCTTGCWRPG